MSAVPGKGEALHNHTVHRYPKPLDNNASRTINVEIPSPVLSPTDDFARPPAGRNDIGP